MTENSDKKNDVNIIVHDKEPCMVELEVFLPPELTEKARKAAIKKIGKEIKLPGFRPGKAPEHVILKEHPQEVEAQWKRSLGDVGFEAMSKQEVPPPLSRETKIIFDVKKLDPQNESVITFTYEVEPKVPSVEVEKFQLNEVPPITVDKEKITEAIRQMQFFYAQWKEVTDRAIQENDYIIVDIESIEEDPPVKVFNDTRFEVTEKGMANWMKKLVMGMKSGESAEAVSEPDDHLTEKEKAEFAPKKVRVTIKKIEEAALPELNDEFAEKVGSKTVDELNESVKNMLQKRADDQVLMQKKDQINRFLLNEAKFPVPNTQLEEEAKHRFNELKHMPQFKGQWDKSSDEEKKKIQSQIHAESEESIRLFYIARQIVRENNIQVTEDEWKNEAIATMSAQAVPGSQMDPSKLSPEVMALALSKIVLAKAHMYILDKATPKKAEKTEPKPEAKEKKPAKKTPAKKTAEKKESPKPKKPKKSS